MQRWRVRKAGRHQGFKWCVYKLPSITPAFHSKSWVEAMAVALSLSQDNQPVLFSSISQAASDLKGELL